jgi:hypothetical protein
VVLKSIIDLLKDHPAIMVKVIQVIEREEKMDTILRKKLENQGLDPYDELNSKSFRRYKEKFFTSLRDFIFTRFTTVFGEITIVSEIVKEAQAVSYFQSKW